MTTCAITLRADSIVLAKGQTLYRERDPAARWFEVCFGMIRTCRYDLAGHRHVTDFVLPSEPFGIEPGNYRAHAEAVTDSVVRPYKSLNFDDPSRAAEDRGILFRALTRADDCVDLLGRRSAAARLAAFLNRMQERSGWLRQLSLPMSREDIADHLALSVETISRTFSDFGKRGIVSFGGPHSITIIDAPAMATLAGNPCNISESGRPMSRVA